MPKTIDLLTRALSIKTASQWARLLNITPSTLTNARRIERLSPALAGNLALEMGEDHQQWMLAAYMESEKEAALIQRLKSKVSAWSNMASL